MKQAHDSPIPFKYMNGFSSAQSEIKSLGTRRTAESDTFIAAINQIFRQASYRSSTRCLIPLKVHFLHAVTIHRMQSNLYYNTFSNYLKQHWGRKIRKLSLHGDFTCPNRDGSIGKGGCTFCNVSSFVDTTAKRQTISEQIVTRRHELTRKTDGYLAYFQAYTSTYAEVSRLKALYDDALKQPGIIGLAVGTRPDCVPDEVLKLLADYQHQGQEIWLELGLQTAHDQTLKRINRGHTFADYCKTITRAQHYGIKVCTHLIVGLPGELREESLATLANVLDCGVDGLKIHPLHVVDGSIMAKAWHANRLKTLSLDEYVDTATTMIQMTPSDVIFHRISAHARPPTLIAPQWCSQKWTAPHAILQRLKETGHQGALTGRPYTLNSSSHTNNFLGSAKLNAGRAV